MDYPGREALTNTDFNQFVPQIWVHRKTVWKQRCVYELCSAVAEPNLWPSCEEGERELPCGNYKVQQLNFTHIIVSDLCGDTQC